MATKKTATAELQKIKVKTAQVKIKGLSPLIMHRWDEKAKKMMLDKQMKKTVRKEAKDPEEQYKASIYWINDEQVGFPADAFKNAMVRGAKSLDLTMVDMRTGFFVHGGYSEKEDRELVQIDGDLSMREDMVRISGGTSDIRYRAQVIDWSATLTISYNETVVSFDQIVNMLEAAGYGVGVGEWRPERNGIFGRFEVQASM